MEDREMIEWLRTFTDQTTGIFQLPEPTLGNPHPHITSVPGYLLAFPGLCRCSMHVDVHIHRLMWRHINTQWDWRDASVVSSAYCSSRGPSFSSQCSHRDSQSSSVHYVFAWYLWKLGDNIACTGSGVIDSCIAL